ncbi:hypothetical protein V6N13_063693 [Hibiscus sabdariffa]
MANVGRDNGYIRLVEGGEGSDQGCGVMIQVADYNAMGLGLGWTVGLLFVDCRGYIMVCFCSIFVRQKQSSAAFSFGSFPVTFGGLYVVAECAFCIEKQRIDGCVIGKGGSL